MKSIILVDDDRTNTRLIKTLLEMDGFRVVACPSVEKARTAIEATTRAFVIDCNLSHDTNGVELLAAIRRGETRAPDDTPVIITSGDDRWHQEAQEAGANHFLLKPYSLSVLTEELSRLIEQENILGQV